MPQVRNAQPEPRSPRNKLRVGFDARWYNDSGVGAYIAGLLPAIARQDVETELVVYEDHSNPVPGLDGMAIKRIPIKARKYSLAEQVEFARRCARDQLELLHCPFFVVPYRTSCPIVVTIHDLIPFLFPIYAWPKAAIVRKAYRMAVKKAGQIIADSHTTARDLQRILAVTSERISVVHLAPADCYTSAPEWEDAAILEQNYGIRAPYIVATSARNWKTKNLSSALQAIELAQRISQIKFQTVVFGHRDGVKAAGGAEKWQSLNLVCTGYISDRDLARIYRLAAAFVMPSQYEGFGLPVLEAMACGCAVVTSNGGALAEVAGSGAQIFDPMDAKGMADALSTLLHKPEELARWRVAALSRARDFCWQKAACETISLYHRTRKRMLSKRVASNI